MEPAHSIVESQHDDAAKVAAHNAAHDEHHDAHDHFYAVSNPKYFGLPVGVLIAATISATAVGITLLKFFGAML